jgi:FkbM family methyltransferase
MGKDVSSYAGMLKVLWAAMTWPKFSRTSYRIVNSLRDQGLVPGSVLDVGANVGQFAVASSKIWEGCVIHAFEPVPESAEKLRDNCRKLGVKVHEVALGDADGAAVIHINSHRHSSSVLSLGERHSEAFPFAREIGAIEVPLRRLDSIFDPKDLPRPILMKLDVQGYESWVLRGATEVLRIVDYVLLEASFRPLYDGERTFNELLPIMGSLGFRFLRPVDWLQDPKTGEVLQMDALFARQD